MFNILRGYIKTFSIPLNIRTESVVDKDTLTRILSTNKTLDYIEYSPQKKMLLVTRNPFGFESKIKKEDGYKGVSGDPEITYNPSTHQTSVVYPKEVDDAHFIRKIKSKLSENDIDFTLEHVKIHYNKALPDKLYEFADWFMENNLKVKKMDEFQRRIIGLTSYFRSAQEGLMPDYNANYQPIEIEMSDYQFEQYEIIREEERKIEKNQKQKSAKAKPAVDVPLEG